MRTFHTFIIAAICASLGLCLFFYKSVILDFPLFPNKQAESWYIEAKIELESRGAPVKAKLYLPFETNGYALVDENFINHGYGFTTKKATDTHNRIATWSKRAVKGKEVIFYRAIIYGINSPLEGQRAVKPPHPTLTYKNDEVKNKAVDNPGYAALINLIEEIHSRSADASSFVTELLKISNTNDERILRIKEVFPETTKEYGLISMVLNYAGIPARIVNGLALADSKRNATFEHWVEYYDQSKWHKLDEDNNEHKTAEWEEKRVMPWWIGSKKFFTIDGNVSSNVSISVKRHTESALTEAIWQGREVSSFVHAFSVFSLPVDVQLLFQILLLIPIGCLVSGVLRQIVGINTFGTFMPVLVALAFRETQLLWGIAFFIIIVGFGLIFRTYFDRLQLLMVPRLTAVLTIVVLAIFVISLICFKLGITSGLSISLFPIVILTMVIERMTLKWEEHGPKEALSAATNSLIVAVIAYWFMNNGLIVHLIVTFPELLLVILAISLVLGRYNGYKLTEYRRFRVLRD